MAILERLVYIDLEESMAKIENRWRRCLTILSSLRFRRLILMDSFDLPYLKLKCQCKK